MSNLFEQENLELSNLTTSEQAASEAVDSAFGEGGLIYELKPDYTQRPDQILAMKKAISCILQNKNYILEGPCGFGKSFVYLFASMYAAARYDKTTVISTNGITLQTQLYEKDAPLVAALVERLTGRSLMVAYMKGRQNYLCRRKSRDFVADSFAQLSMLHSSRTLSEIVEWVGQTKQGDVAELSFRPEREEWSQFACTEDGECLGKTCEFYGECCYNEAKKRCQASNVIITNYHLLLANEATGGQILPKCDILVCDEAHNMADVTRDFNEQKVSYYSYLNLQRKITSFRHTYAGYIDEEETQIKPLLEYAKSFFEKLTAELAPKNNTETLSQILDPEPLYHITVTFARGLDRLREGICPDGELMEVDQITSRACYELEALAERADVIARSLYMICLQADDNQAFFVQKEKNDLLSLHAKPVKVDDYLEARFFGKQESQGGEELATIVTSATLSVGGDFNYIRSELGIREAEEMDAKSPFDLENQQLWYLPPNCIDGNKEGFQERMLGQFVELCEACRGGVLGLFTSIYNMRQAAMLLRRKTNLTVYLQGEAPQGRLLADFAADHDSVLIGTRSLFEGVDISGQSLRCVFLDKLPFVSPEDPVAKKLMAEDGSFFRYSIPNMIIVLKQAIGRGVRSVSDKSIIAFADGRFATARYSRRIMKSFNYTKTTTRSLDDVARFLGYDGFLL